MKHKILFNYSVILVLGFSLFMMSGCSGKKQVEGIVQDLFGNGVEGVSVQVIKSRFATTTDKAGHYSVDYAPGTFTINFSKPGYTTHKLDLTIQEKTKFPAETVVMYPIPEGKGMYYIGEKELIEIKPVLVKEETKKVHTKIHSWPTYHYRFYASTKGNLIVKSGEARFIDTNPKRIAFAKLGDKENIQYYTQAGYYSPKYIYNGIIDDQKILVGDEKLVIRIVELTSGNYAWVELLETLPVAARKLIEPSEGLPCFPFSVWSVDRQNLHRGGVYATQGKFKEAKEEFESILQDDPLNYNAKIFLVVIEDVIDRKIESNAAAYLFKGITHGIKEQWDESIVELNKAIRLDPNFTQAYIKRGLAYISLGQYQQAIMDYDKAISLNPKEAVSFYNRGIAYKKLGKHQRAIDDYSKAINFNPKDTNSFYNRGNTYNYLNKKDRACDDWRKACELGNCDGLNWAKEQGFCKQ